MPLTFLVLAIASEVVGTSLLKSTEGFSKLGPSLLCFLAYTVSLVFLSRAVRDIPVGVAYALWAGIGTVAIVTIGAVFLGDTLRPSAIAGVFLVVTGVVLLNLSATH
jgi:small multidrug resistance pump